MSLNLVTTQTINKNVLKVSFLLPSLKFGGAERVVLNFAKLLSKRGYSVSILVMQPIGELFEEAVSFCRVVDLRCGRTYKLPRALRQYILSESPDALVSNFWKLNVCAALATRFRKSLNLLLWEHNTFNKTPLFAKLLFTLSSSVLYRRASSVICVSESVERDINRLTLFLRNTHVLRNAIRPPDIADLNQLRKKKSDTYRLIFVGRLAKQKNIPLLFKALKLVSYQIPVVLTLVGSGPEEAALRQEVKRLKLEEFVSFAGYISDPYRLMIDSDCLVLTSDDEGLPSVLVEALYVDISVVATNSSSGVDYILCGGRYGKIVPRGDVDALAAAIITELTSPSSKVGLSNHLRQFTPEYVVNEFEALLFPSTNRSTS